MCFQENEEKMMKEVFGQVVELSSSATMTQVQPSKSSQKRRNFNKFNLSSVCSLLHKHYKKTSKLVDPASDHILRSKIKPCTCKSK